MNSYILIINIIITNKFSLKINKIDNKIALYSKTALRKMSQLSPSHPRKSNLARSFCAI